jgi:hypothetical protein
MSSPRMYENMATPARSTKAHMILSKLLTGYKSPKPTVDRDVKEK